MHRDIESKALKTTERLKATLRGSVTVLQLCHLKEIFRGRVAILLLKTAILKQIPSWVYGSKIGHSEYPG